MKSVLMALSVLVITEVTMVAAEAGSFICTEEVSQQTSILKIEPSLGSGIYIKMDQYPVFSYSYSQKNGYTLFAGVDHGINIAIPDRFLDKSVSRQDTGAVNGGVYMRGNGIKKDFYCSNLSKQ